MSMQGVVAAVSRSDKHTFSKPNQAGIELVARVAQPGDLDDGAAAEPQARTDGQAQQVEAAGGDVLAHLAWGDVEPRRAQLVVELGVDEVDLAEVALGRIAARTRERCFTVAPIWASPSTPSPASSRIWSRARFGDHGRDCGSQR